MRKKYNEFIPSVLSSDPTGENTHSLSPSDTPSLSPSGLTGGSTNNEFHLNGFSGRTPDGVCRRMTRERELSSSDISSLCHSGPRAGIQWGGNLMPKALGFITAICITLMVSTIALADDTTTTVETCANGAGTVVIGAVTGHKYCNSNTRMNWWNAWSWCDALGRRLFAATDCACSSTNCSSWIVCPEMKGVTSNPDYTHTDVSWTGIPWPGSTSKACNVSFKTGHLSNANDNYKPSTYYALCY